MQDEIWKTFSVVKKKTRWVRQTEKHIKEKQKEVELEAKRKELEAVIESMDDREQYLAAKAERVAMRRALKKEKVKY